MTTMEMAKAAFETRNPCDEWFEETAPNFEAFAEMVRDEEREACDEEAGRLRHALVELAALNAWANFGECRAFDIFGHTDGVLDSATADALARAALTP